MSTVTGVETKANNHLLVKVFVVVVLAVAVAITIVVPLIGRVGDASKSTAAKVTMAASSKSAEVFLRKELKAYGRLKSIKEIPYDKAIKLQKEYNPFMSNEEVIRYLGDRNDPEQLEKFPEVHFFLYETERSFGVMPVWKKAGQSSWNSYVE